MSNIKEFNSVVEYEKYIEQTSDRPIVSLVNETRKIYYDRYSIFKFYIDDVEYEAEEGMTWYMWTESKYNTLGCYWLDYYNLKLDSKPSCTIFNVFKSTLIIEQNKYYFKLGVNIVQ